MSVAALERVDKRRWHTLVDGCHALCDVEMAGVDQVDVGVVDDVFESRLARGAVAA